MVQTLKAQALRVKTGGLKMNIEGLGLTDPKVKILGNYKNDWLILDTIPKGWVVCKNVGGPKGSLFFVTNGKSPISGMHKRALVKRSETI